MKTLKILLLIIVILALIGGAVDYSADQEQWRIIIHKSSIFESIKNGLYITIDFFKNLLSEMDKIKGVDLS